MKVEFNPPRFLQQRYMPYGLKATFAQVMEHHFSPIGTTPATPVWVITTYLIAEDREAGKVWLRQECGGDKVEVELEWDAYMAFLGK